MRVPMNTEKLLWIQPVFQIGERFAEQVFLYSAMQQDIIVCRLDPIDGLHRNEVKTFTISDNQPVWPFARF